LEDIYSATYTSGARIHTNSWGGSNWYDEYALETDKFLYENSDFVLLFAKTMKQILEEDKKEEEEDMAVRMKAKEERLRAAEAAKATPTPNPQTSYCEKYPHEPECEEDYAERAVYPSGGGGSKKKSRKRTTRNRRRSHRNRRHHRASTRKYKK
jgi:hypothetical protein